MILSDLLPLQALFSWPPLSITCFRAVSFCSLSLFFFPRCKKSCYFLKTPKLFLQLLILCYGVLTSSLPEENEGIFTEGNQCFQTSIPSWVCTRLAWACEGTSVQTSLSAAQRWALHSQVSALHSLDLLPWGDHDPSALEASISWGDEMDGKFGNVLSEVLRKIHCFALEINRWSKKKPFIPSVFSYPSVCLAENRNLLSPGKHP